MALDTKTLKILNLPEMATSRVRELQWGIDWYEKLYKEMKYKEDLAWKIYNDAVDSNANIHELNGIFIACKLFEANRIAAWHEWQECKRQYLEMMN